MKAALRTPAIFLGLILLCLPMLGMMKMFLVPPWVFRLAFLGVILPILTLIVYFSRKKLSVPVNNMLWAFLLMAVLACVTAVFATNQYDAWYGAIKWGALLLLLVLAHNCAVSESDRRLLITCMALGGIFMAVVGVSQYLFGLEFYQTPTNQPSWPTATSSHRNQASNFVVMTLPLTFYLAYSAIDKKRLFVWSVAVSVMAVFLVYGRARQALVASVAEMMFFAVVYRFFYLGKNTFNPELKKHLKINFFACLALFLCLIMMPPVGKPFSVENSSVYRLLERGEIYQKEGVSLETVSAGRTNTWLNTLSMIPDSLLGKGYLNWQVEYPRYSASSVDHYNLSRTFYWRYTHNDYLQTIVEFGLLSVIPFVLLLTGIFTSFRSSSPGNGNNYEKSFSLFALLVGLVGIGIVMFFSFPLSMTLQPIYLTVYIGIISASYIGTREKLVKIRASILVVFCLGLLLLAGWFGYKSIMSLHHSYKAEFLHRHIEENLSDLEKYPDVSLFRNEIYDQVMASTAFVSFHPTLDINRGGLLSYLAITEKDKEKKAFYYSQSVPYWDRAKKAFPYYALPYVVEELFWRGSEETGKRISALKKAIELAPGDHESVRTLADYYLEKHEVIHVYQLLASFFDRFYDSELLDIYAFSAQETGNQKRAVGTLLKIDLADRDSSFINEKLYIENKKISRFIDALSQQAAAIQ